MDIHCGSPKGGLNLIFSTQKMATEALRLFAEIGSQVSVEETVLPRPECHQILVKTVYSFVSAGTELSVLQMSENPNFRRPVTREGLGYSLAGIVVETGADVTHVKAGDKVACLGEGAQHSTYVLMARNLVIPLPPGVSLKEGSLIAMLCFSLEGVHKAHPEFGENALVAGAGMMGHITAQLLLAMGNHVWMVDRNLRRLDFAPDPVRTLNGSPESWRKLAEETQPYGVEAAYVCLGGEATSVFEKIKTVMSRSPDGIAHGRVVFPGGATVTVSMASPCGNLQLLSSAKAGPGYRDAQYEAGESYPLTYIPWDVYRNATTMLAAVANKHLDLSSLITHVIPFEKAQSAYNLLAEPDTGALGILLSYDPVEVPAPSLNGNGAHAHSYV